MRRAHFIILGLLALIPPAGVKAEVLAGAHNPVCRAAVAYSEARRGAAVLVLVAGTPVCEAYAGDAAVDRPMELWSGTKSFSGVMAAAAVQDGLLTLDEPVSRTLPEWADDPLKAKATLRQLLSLTVGLKSQVGRPPAYLEAVALTLNQEPGAFFQYGPAPFQVFGEVMKRKLSAAGLAPDPVAYLQRRVFAPIGLRDVQWRRSPSGDPLLPQGARLSARDWARFGEFVRAGGSVEGRQIVDPAAWRALFSGSAANPAYGLGWWLPDAPLRPDPVSKTLDLSNHPGAAPADLVIAAGAGDQRLYVIPSLGLTVVRQAPLSIGRQASADNAPQWSDYEFLTAALPLAAPSR